MQRRLSKADEGILRQAKHNQLLQKESGVWRMENGEWRMENLGGEWLGNLLEDRRVIHLSTFSSVDTDGAEKDKFGLYTYLKVVTLITLMWTVIKRER